ncbi:tripartite tricarboxylate transporter TctB family protein [Alkalicoccus halolimnae]|uniref:Tripartite tricarboxylate transporter TctB family protein n=1 Tax=Alkalicoccus halolimnae TaxID=1667239 RepID=A0AAJ8LWM5_9BACI|nr:tripartite tricarboxylate transporter TctB family protein [Alkalicoccus halolimnae]
MGELIVACLLLLVSIVIFIQSGDFTHLNESQLGPGTYPQLISVLLASLSLILIISQSRKLLKEKSEMSMENVKAGFGSFYTEYKLVLHIIGLLALYIILIDITGFIITTILFVIAAGMLIGPKKKKNLITLSIVSVILTFSTYLFFENVLYVRFPGGLFF